MKTAKFHPDEEGNFYIPRCVAVIWIGVQKDTPTIMAIVNEGDGMGKDIRFHIKELGDEVSMSEMQQFATALVTSDAEYFLFGDKPSIIQGGGQMVPPGMAAPGRSFR